MDTYSICNSQPSSALTKGLRRTRSADLDPFEFVKENSISRFMPSGVKAP
uniref:AGC-kinase C-terminal domain-containing protein n=1 Tax=Rodentolepis nana TaxID=102285 RepID=A0A0R3TVZ2_RODNA